MIPKYIPQTPFRKNMLVRMDIDINEEPILASVEEEMQPSEHEDKMDDLLDHPPADQTGSDIFKAALEESYHPMRVDPSSINSKSHDITQEINPTPPDTLLADNNEEEHEADMIELLQDEAPLPVASDYQEYYNEAAMKAKTRNKLPDSEFGLPRLRKYPLNDEKHVRQAVAMFKHCKDPKDRAELARRIFAKIDEMKIDIKIGKNSALYDYAPKALQEATIVPVLNESDAVVIYGMEKGMSKRTKEDKQKEHLLHNSFFYNSTIYMGKNHLKAIKAMDEYSFLEYFYPNFKGFNLYTRLSSALGRLGMSKEVYEKFGMRYPFEEDLTKEIGWSNLTEEQEEDFEIEVSTSSYEDMTWYHQNTYDDLDHVKYCLALYSIVGKMMNDPYFKMDQLSANHLGILTDWGQQVSYYYQLFIDSKEFSKEYFFYAQCLHDLLWNCNDNPDDPDVIVMNIFSMIDHMSCAKHLFMNINEGVEMISKEECTAYMVHELGMEDDMFLLPGTSEYPIINQGSIRMAMDMINQISADERAEYSRNLNRKYKEFGCTFSISVDHPYAKYADQNIIDHMNRVLMEGDTAVSDQGTSTSGGDLSTEPWYVRMDVNGNVGQDLLRNKELGPNDKTHPDVNFTRHSSVF